MQIRHVFHCGEGMEVLLVWLWLGEEELPQYSRVMVGIDVPVFQQYAF